MKRACDRLACIVLLTLTPGWAAASLQDQIDAAWRAGGHDDALAVAVKNWR